MKFYQERLEKHKEFLRDQKFLLLKEINKSQKKLQQIESLIFLIMSFIIFVSN